MRINTSIDKEALTMAVTAHDIGPKIIIINNI